MTHRTQGDETSTTTAPITPSAPHRASHTPITSPTPSPSPQAIQDSPPSVTQPQARPITNALAVRAFVSHQSGQPHSPVNDHPDTPQADTP